MVPNFHTPSEISSAKQLVFKMLSVCLSNIIHKSGRNSVNRPAHEVEVHDIMETVDAIDFTTSSDLCCAINLERMPKDCLGAEVTATTTSVTDWLVDLEHDVQQLKATNELKATNVSKFTPKDSASLVINDFSCSSQEPILRLV